MGGSILIGKLEPEESVLSTDIIDDDLYNGGKVYPASPSTIKLLGDISKALYDLGWNVDDQFKVNIGGAKVCGIEQSSDANPKWSPPKGTVNYQKDAFIVIKNQSRKETK